MQFNKSMILEELRNSSLPIEQYWVVMGAALVLHGVKETTRDIDIGCSLELFNYLLGRGYKLKLSGSGKKKITINKNINIYCEWNINGFVIIDSIQVADLDTIISDKKKLGRDKDIVDINSIILFKSKKEAK
ncbi:MAG: hypothetical protein HFJ06_07915 [Lachnospiraceae bacterium]|nr:hypothetical protein [Lachnospiraceae bacterium]